MRTHLLAAILAIVLPAASTAATIVSAVSATSSAGSFSTYDIGHTIDQSGMAANYVSGVTDFDAYVPNTATLGGANSFNAWFSPGGTTSSVIDFFLGTTYSLDAFALWTDYQGVGQGVNAFRLLASNDSSFASSSVLGAYNATAGTGIPESNNVGQVFTFSATSASYIRMEILSNHGSDFVVGFSEAAFRTADSQTTAVPVPAALPLMLAGIAAFGLIRRKRG